MYRAGQIELSAPHNCRLAKKEKFLWWRTLEIGLRIFYLLFLIQKQTPREARTRQSTEMTMEREARNPRPWRTPARPSLFMAGFPKALRVVNWYSWVLEPAWLWAVT